jgi:hypothetical protein
VAHGGTVPVRNQPVYLPLLAAGDDAAFFLWPFHFDVQRVAKTRNEHHSIWPPLVRLHHKFYALDAANLTPPTEVPFVRTFSHFPYLRIAFVSQATCRPAAQPGVSHIS